MGWVAGVSIRTRMLSMALLAVMTIAPAWAAPLFLDAGSSLPGDMPFSAAVRQGAVLYLSGQLGVLPGTRTLPPGGIRVEARQAILNSESVRKANGRGTTSFAAPSCLLLSPSGPLSMQYGSRCWINPIRRAVHWALLDWP